MLTSQQGSWHSHTERRMAACRRLFLRRRAAAVIVIMLLGLLVPSPALTADAQTEEAAPLRFGLLPFASPVFLFNRFMPLANYLRDEIGTSVSLESARNYSVHVQRMEAGEYDLVLTAPHFVPIALDSEHYEVLASPRQDLASSYVVASDDPARSLVDLAGRRIATPSPEALVTLAGREYLLSQLPPGAPAPEFISFSSHNAAVHAITSGLAEAAVTSNNMARLEISRNLPVRILDESDHYPAVAVLAHRHLPRELRDRITFALITMTERQDSDDVRAHMTYYPGYKPASAADYERFRSLLSETRRYLGAAPDNP